MWSRLYLFCFNKTWDFVWRSQLFKANCKTQQEVTLLLSLTVPYLEHQPSVLPLVDGRIITPITTAECPIKHTTAFSVSLRKHRSFLERKGNTFPFSEYLVEWELKSCFIDPTPVWQPYKPAITKIIIYFVILNGAVTLMKSTIISLNFKHYFYF